MSLLSYLITKVVSISLIIASFIYIKNLLTLTFSRPCLFILEISGGAGNNKYVTGVVRSVNILSVTVYGHGSTGLCGNEFRVPLYRIKKLTHISKSKKPEVFAAYI